MKTVVSTFLTFFFTVALFAQNFVADEFIVEYLSNSTLIEQQAVRNLYGINNTTSIGDNIELWSDIPFPITFTENGATTIINNVEELLWHIGIQEGDGNSNGSNVRANVNNGNLNLLLQLEQDGAFNEDGTFDPLPYCDEVHNDRLIGLEDYTGNPYQSNLKIVIVDQQASGAINLPYDNSPSNTGGDHGSKVLSVIQNILTQAGATEVEYYNVVAFDAEGTSTTSALISAMEAIKGQYENGNWDENDKVIVNFSANMVIPETFSPEDYFGIIEEYWSGIFGGYEGFGELGSNISLVSSAGNQGSNSDHVFPGSGYKGLFSEITVAGTQNCFSEPWEDTNSNPAHFEIAAEADNILTHDGSNYYFSSGTSFSSALVTAVLAQLSLSRPNYNMDEVRQLLFSTSDIVPALMGTVQNGRVLNLGNFIPWVYVPTGRGGLGGNGGPGTIRPLQSATPTSPLTLTTTPNPFATTALVTIELPEAGDVTISMYNMIGQRVHEEFISNQQDMIELEWPTPATLTSGTYLLRVQAGEAVEQMMMVKQ